MYFSLKDSRETADLACVTQPSAAETPLSDEGTGLDRGCRQAPRSHPLLLLLREQRGGDGGVE